MQPSPPRRVVGAKFALFAAITVVWCCTGAEVSISDCNGNSQPPPSPSPRPTTPCHNSTSTLQACYNCCRDRFPGNPEPPEKTQCDSDCEQRFMIAIVLDPDYDPINAKSEPAEPWSRSAYALFNSIVYPGMSCECAMPLIQKEANEALLADAVLGQLPAYMDTAQTRGFIEALTPCERAALLADAIRWNDRILEVTPSQFEEIHDQVVTEVLDRMAAEGKQGEEAFRSELNQLVGEIWYDRVVQSGPNYAVEGGEGTE